MAIEDIDLPRQGTHGHTPDDRLQAAMAWCVTGTAQGASELTGIARKTIDDWTRKEWWVPLIAEARLLKQDELDAKLTTIIDKCAQRLLERLDDPEGLSKAGIQQIATTLAIGWDKRELSRGGSTSRTERVSASDRLNKLRDEFAGMQVNMAKASDKVKTH